MSKNQIECTTSTPKPLTADEIISGFVIHDPEEIRKILNKLLIEFMSLTDSDQDERAEIVCAYWSMDKLLENIINYLGRIMS